MYPTSALVRPGSGEPPIGLAVAEAVVCALLVQPDPQSGTLSERMLGPVV
jgi:hypothetical protein